MKPRLSGVTSIAIALAISMASIGSVSAQGSDGKGGAGESGDGRVLPLLKDDSDTADRDRDRDQDQDCVDGKDQSGDQTRDQDCDDGPDRDRVRDRIMLMDIPELQDQHMYGYKLMSQQERDEFRQQLQAMSSQEEVDAYVATHRNKMRMRAKEQGVELPE